MMKPLTPYDIARNFLGVAEVPGKPANPWIVAWQSEMIGSSLSDEESWCSSFMGGVCRIAGVRDRSRSLAARSWLDVGIPIKIEDARPGWDLVVLSRPGGESWWAHVGWFDALYSDSVSLVGGNQSNMVSVATFPAARFLGARRLSN